MKDVVTKILVMVLVLSMANVSFATVLTYQEGVSGGVYADTDDGTMYMKYYPNYGNGQGTDLMIYATNYDTMRSLIAMRNIIGSNPGQVPTGSVINSAILYIKINPSLSYVQPARAYRLLRDWSNGQEGTENYDDIDASGEMDTTWNLATDFYDSEGTDVAWETAGAWGASDVDKTSPGQQATVVQLNGQDWLAFDITDKVQAWSNGAPNYGVLITADAFGAKFKLYSSNVATASDRPILKVDYVPEPTTIGLLLIGIVGLISRR